MKRILYFTAIILFFFMLSVSGIIAVSADFSDVEGYALSTDSFVEESFVIDPVKVGFLALTGKTQAINVRCYGSDKEIESFCKNLDVRIQEVSELYGIRIIYGFSNRIRVKPVSINGKSVNVQIVKKGAVVTIGSPLISVGY